MKAEYEFTVKFKVQSFIDSVMECGDLTETSEEVIRYLCDRLVEEGFIYEYEFLERKMEAK